MSVHGQVIRIDKRVSELWPRTVLQAELEKWNRAWERYWDCICQHARFGGQVNTWRVSAFRVICGQAIQQIQGKLDMIDILERPTPKSF